MVIHINIITDLGDIPLEQHLSILNERFDQFSPLPRTDFSQSAPRFASLQRVETTCPLDPLTDPKKQNVTSISFHTNELSDGYFEHFALNVLVALLTDGHSAPLRQALLDTNIGTDWSPNSGHHAFGKTAFVAFGVQGVQEGDEALVEAEILRVLSEVAETGFNPDRIEGVLHQMELGLKHKSAHFGTNLMWKATSSWFDGVDPIEILQWNSRINKLRQEIAVGPFFQDMIKKHFLDNPSRLILTMRPDPDFDEKFKTKEKKLLSEKLDALSETDKTKVYEDGLSLLEAQEKPDDLSSLPTLTVRDIPRISPHYPLSRYDINEIRTYWRTTPTNGITYFKAVTTLTNLPNYLRPYLPLFADALSSLGTTQKSASEFEDEINLKTDGLRCSVLVNTLPDSISWLLIFANAHVGLDKVSESLVISGACLDKNIPAMYSLLREFIYETNWDNEKKLESLIKNNASGVVNSIASAGSQFAEAYASSKLTPSRVYIS
jgi:presequence protease